MLYFHSYKDMKIVSLLTVMFQGLELYAIFVEDW